MKSILILTCLWAAGDREVTRTHVLTPERVSTELVYYGSPVLSDRVDALRLCEDVQDVSELKDGALDEILDTDWHWIVDTSPAR